MNGVRSADGVHAHLGQAGYRTYPAAIISATAPTVSSIVTRESSLAGWYRST